MFQELDDDTKQKVVQDLVWFLNDRWIGWLFSPHKNLIEGALYQTDITTAEKNYGYCIDIGDQFFINCYPLEGYLFPSDMFRVRNHLQANEMVISIPQNGLIGVAHASSAQRILAILDFPNGTIDNGIRHHYNELAQKMRDLVDIEEIGAIGTDYSTAMQLARQNLSAAYNVYSEKAAFALSEMAERHRFQASQVFDSTGKLSSSALRSLARLCQRYHGDIDSMERDGVVVADFLAPARLLVQIRHKIGAFPSIVLVKVSKAVGTLYLQAVYDCLQRSGLEDFKAPVQFVIMETAETGFLANIRQTLNKLNSLFRSFRSDIEGK
jgi:hypothetical protein